MIRILTLQRMAERGNRSLFRVRWRALTYDAKRQEHIPDDDGEAGKPDTWARWDAEYCQTLAAALECVSDRSGLNAKRPAGEIDRVPVREVWARFQEMPKWQEGRFATLNELRELNPRFAQSERVVPAPAVAFEVPADWDRKQCSRRLEELERQSRTASLSPAELGEFQALIEQLSAHS